MTSADDLDRLRTIERIILRARETGNTQVMREASALLGRLIRAQHPEPPEDNTARTRPGPHDARTRAREAPSDPLNGERAAEGLRRLKQGRDQCSATRRDGQQCQAPAIAGGLVCRRHGGAAPQVAIAAEYMNNLTAAREAEQAWEQARGTERETDALIEALDAERGIEEYQIKMRLAKLLRDGLKDLRDGT